jgi:hypothetical protein
MIRSARGLVTDVEPGRSLGRSVAAAAEPVRRRLLRPVGGLEVVGHAADPGGPGEIELGKPAPACPAATRKPTSNPPDVEASSGILTLDTQRIATGSWRGKDTVSDVTMIQRNLPKALSLRILHFD